MISETEKPLLSDYHVQAEEKDTDVSGLRQTHGVEPRPLCSCRTASAKQAKWGKAARKFENVAMKVISPISRRAVAMGCESFVPLPPDQECQKAARIVRCFSYNHYCVHKDENLPSNSSADNAETSRPGSVSSPPHIVSIPPCTIADAVGLLIFTTGRVGFGHMSMSVGSGIFIVRRDSGEWGMPVPIQTYSLGGGPIALGAEVTDRVYVVNNFYALKLFESARFEIGPELAMAVGPYGGGGGVTFSGMPIVPKESQRDTLQPDTAVQCKCGCHDGALQGLRQSLAQPIYCYMRSRGLYAGLQAEGTVFIRREDLSISDDVTEALISTIKEAEHSFGGRVL